MNTCEFIVEVDRTYARQFDRPCGCKAEPENFCIECETLLCWSHVGGCYECGEILCELCHEDHAKRTGHNVDMNPQYVKDLVAKIVAKIDGQKSIVELVDAVMRAQS